MCIRSAAQRTVTNTQMVGIGHENVLDTYLSPEHYTGTQLRYMSHTVRSNDTLSWQTRIVHSGHMASTKSRSGDGSCLDGTYTLSVGRQRRWVLPASNLSLAAGVSGELCIGFLYNTHGGNNPAQARLAANICPVVSAEYSGLTLWNRPLIIGCDLQAPLLGVCFSPHYGQSYYEIFTRGNYDRNCVVTTPFSAPSLTALLSVSYPIGRTTLRIGYLGDWRQQAVNGLRQHEWSDMLMVGLVRRFSIIRK